MEFKVYSMEELRLEWEILVPQTNSTLRSPVFSFHGSDWRFVLKTVWSDYIQEDVWIIRIENDDQTNDCHKFKVEVVAENNDIFYLLTVAKVKYPSSENLTLLQAQKSSFSDYFFKAKERESIILFFSVFNSIFSKYEPNRKGKPQFDISSGSRHEINILGSNDAVIVSDTTKENKSIQTPSSMNVLPCLQSLSDDMYKLMNNICIHDATFRFGDVIFPVHSVVIGARSEVLKTMFQKNRIKNTTDAITVDDIEIPIFRHFIRYLYTGMFPELTTDIVIELYNIGKKYAVESLKRRCSNFLKENLGRNNAFKILKLANAHKDVDLKEETVIFILEKEMHLEEDEWIPFCDDEPKLAIEVLNRTLKFSN